MTKTNKKAVALLVAISIFICLCASACKGGNSPAAHVHVVTNMIEEVPATCTQTGVKEHGNCDKCGVLVVKDGDKLIAATEADLIIEKTPHVFKNKIVSDEYLVSEATADTPQTFAKACACGLKSDSESDRYTVGKTLNEYAKENKEDYRPVSLTVSLYDSANCVYGFSWNTAKTPARPVLEIKQPGDAEYKKVRARYEGMSSYEFNDADGKQISRSYIKVEAQLTPDTTYEYRIGDAYLDAYTEPVTIKAVNPTESGKWSFAHVSDSQSGTIANGKGTGEYYRRTLSAIANGGNDFIIHTGDVVEYSKYESFWTEMLDTNFDYLSKTPVMAISGNHETTYQGRAGESETYKHFYYKMLSQDVTQGFYYSFSYGNVKFIMLNTNRLLNDKLTTDQYKWLKNELAAKTEKWTIVSLHNPIYSVGKYGAAPANNKISLALKTQLADLFARTKVDIVLQGHDHCVSRTFPIGLGGVVSAETEEEIEGIKYTKDPDGVLYLMNGPAGNQSRTITACDENVYAYGQNSNICSWAEFEIERDTIIVSVKYYEGGIKEYCKWGIKKTA